MSKEAKIQKRKVKDPVSSTEGNNSRKGGGMTSSVPDDVGQAPSRSLPPGVAQAGSTRERGMSSDRLPECMLDHFQSKSKK